MRDLCFVSDSDRRAGRQAGLDCRLDERQKKETDSRQPLIQSYGVDHYGKQQAGCSFAAAPRRGGGGGAGAGAGGGRL